MRLRNALIIAIFYAAFAVFTVTAIQAEDRKDWIDVVGEHIGGWEQLCGIELHIISKKVIVRIDTEDGNCYECFAILKEKSGYDVFCRNCGKQDYNKLN